jgi:hypothetical protein
MILRLPYSVAAVLAEAVAVACAGLVDPDGKACLVRPVDRTEFLAAAVDAVNAVAEVARGDVVTLLPPERPARRPPLHLGDVVVPVEPRNPLVREFPADVEPTMREVIARRRRKLLADGFVPTADVQDGTVEPPDIAGWSEDFDRNGWVRPRP